MSLPEAREKYINDTLMTMSNLLGLSVLTKNIIQHSDTQKVIWHISVKNPGLFIEHNGENALKAFQLLLNAILRKHDSTFPRIIIHVNDYEQYKERKQKPKVNHSALCKKIISVTKEVKRWGESVTLSVHEEDEKELIIKTVGNDPELEVTSKSSTNGNGGSPTYQCTVQLKE